MLNQIIPNNYRMSKQNQKSTTPNNLYPIPLSYNFPITSLFNSPPQFSQQAIADILNIKDPFYCNLLEMIKNQPPPLSAKPLNLNPKGSNDVSDKDVEQKTTGKERQQKRSDQIKTQRKQSKCGKGDQSNRYSLKCFNQFCQNTTNLVKAKQMKNQLICKKCLDFFRKKQYCQFCYQIYSNEINDEKKWIACDICQKWNHVDCQKLNRDKDIEKKHDQIQYLCVSCQQKKFKRLKTRIVPQFEDDQYYYQGFCKKRRVQSQSDGKSPEQNEVRTKVFRKAILKYESFEMMQIFLNSLNYKLGINDEQTRKDIRSIQNLIKKDVGGQKEQCDKKGSKTMQKRHKKKK